MQTRPAPQTEAASATEDTSLATLCKALAHPSRVRILRLLLERDACVCGDIVDALPLAQSTVSEHLRILKDAGLVTGDIDGPRICYCANRGSVQELERLLRRLRG